MYIKYKRLGLKINVLWIRPTKLLFNSYCMADSVSLVYKTVEVASNSIFRTNSGHVR